MVLYKIYKQNHSKENASKTTSVVLCHKEAFNCKIIVLKRDEIK